MDLEATWLDDILKINNLLQTEKDYTKIIDKLITVSRKACNADGCFFYSLTDKFLNLEYCFNKTLHIDRCGTENMVISPNISLNDVRKKTNKSFVELCALNAHLINSPNIYLSPDIDNSFFDRFDSEHDYRTMSALTVPIMSRNRMVIGVAQFINATDEKGKAIPFSPEAVANVESLGIVTGIILENYRLKESYTQLLESFIEVLARAIDAKSPYTGAHCQRVPVIARMLTTAAVQQEKGPLKRFDMTPDDWYSLHIASWLHDCGKVTTPEYIVDKATKLETIYNRIHEIRNRFEILRRDAHIDYLKKRLNNIDTQDNLQAEYLGRIKKLEEDFDFIARCNIGDTALTGEDVKRLEAISQIKFTRYFSRMKGLSWAERDNIKDRELYDKPSRENLIQNRDDHLFNNYNNGELYNLEVLRGTINKEEREKINEHITVTIDMLKALPFPQELANVVEYAGAHHERMDGKGYPNGLTGEQMSVPSRIMAIADIFEALTANDRPYKEPKKLSEVLHIMQDMKNNGHIDPDLYQVFIENEVWKDYADQYISPEQIDSINPKDYL